jgi:hypothetical protein
MLHRGSVTGKWNIHAWTKSRAVMGSVVPLPVAVLQDRAKYEM